MTSPPLRLLSDLQQLETTYIPLDSWVYPAVVRLQAMGYIDTAFLGLRPWTRASIAHMLWSAQEAMDQTPDEEALRLLLAVRDEIGTTDVVARPKLESVYTRALGISGTTLRDSFHAGQTIVNDYGRPYQKGFNHSTGFSARAQSGRFGIYFRGEYQYAPGGNGYSAAIANQLAEIDYVPLATNPRQDTIPLGSIARASQFRVLEGYASVHLLGHEIALGKMDHWMGPGQGGAFFWSNNAPNLYAFQIDRTEPLYIPILSRLTGPFRYEFHVGSLKGHTAPNAPWVHSQKINFKPTRNVEIGFSRATIWGGEGHAPVTLHTFLHSFFSFQNVGFARKISRDDPGARFGTFDFSWRLPFVRNWLTLYADSLGHDDVSPASAPRRAGVRPGLYLSHTPGLPKLDIRVEGGHTDPPVRRSSRGDFLYTEYIYRHGYTNEGRIMGDAMGRQGKTGQAWFTWHLSPQEQIQASWKMNKVAKDFVPGGVTQHSFRISAVKRIHRELEIKAWLQVEQWKAPFLATDRQSNAATAFQITWYPRSQ